MTWQEIQSKFENVKQDGWDEYQLIATCPAHDDRKPSLSIKLADDKVLIYCQAGCETKDVLAVTGLTMADLNLTSSVQEVYDYQDETGRTVQRRLRFIPKDFRWQHIEIDFNTREEVWRNGKGSYPELAYHMPGYNKGGRGQQACHHHRG